MGGFSTQPVAYEHESNGSIENGVKAFKGLFRVHLLALDRKLGAQIRGERVGRMVQRSVRMILEKVQCEQVQCEMILEKVQCEKGCEKGPDPEKEETG